jgi:hypothetical protein
MFYNKLQLFTTAIEEIPPTLETSQMNQLMHRLMDYQEGERLKVVNDQLKKAVKLFNLKGIKRRLAYD